MPPVAAEELKTTNYYIASMIVQNGNKNASDLNENTSHLNWTRSSYSRKTSPQFQKIDFSRYLPIPLEIDASSPTLFDPEVRLGLDPKWKEETLSCTFGIKYSFSRFELQDFAKSLISLFKNPNKDIKQKGGRRSLPVSFYLSVPEY